MPDHFEVQRLSESLTTAIYILEPFSFLVCSITLAISLIFSLTYLPFTNLFDPGELKIVISVQSV